LSRKSGNPPVATVAGAACVASGFPVVPLNIRSELNALSGLACLFAGKSASFGVTYLRSNGSLLGAWSRKPQ
jgi:hypothetical protein